MSEKTTKDLVSDNDSISKEEKDSNEKEKDSNYCTHQQQQQKSTKSSKSKFEDPKLDPDWLYNVLRKEITKEAKYDLENDAKMRAITQGTVNYEQFRQMVLGSHIRPLEKRDKVQGYQNGKRPHVVWNTATVNKTKADDDGDKKESVEEIKSTDSSIFTNTQNEQS